MKPNSRQQEADKRHAQLFADLLRVINQYAGSTGYQWVEIIDATEIKFTSRYVGEDGNTSLIIQTVTLSQRIVPEIL